MSDIIINMHTKAAEGSESLEVGDLKPTDAAEKPGIEVKLDDSTSDVAAKAEDVSKDEEKTAEALSADEKAPGSVKVEASPETETALNSTDSAETAEDMAKEVAKETDDYVTEGSDAKADDSSSLIDTERESQSPMNKASASTKAVIAKIAVVMAKNAAKKQARKSILMKMARAVMIPDMGLSNNQFNAAANLGTLIRQGAQTGGVIGGLRGASKDLTEEDRKKGKDRVSSTAGGVLKGGTVGAGLGGILGIAMPLLQARADKARAATSAVKQNSAHKAVLIKLAVSACKKKKAKRGQTKLYKAKDKE